MPLSTRILNLAPEDAVSGSRGKDAYVPVADMLVPAGEPDVLDIPVGVRVKPVE